MLDIRRPLTATGTRYSTSGSDQVRWLIQHSMLRYAHNHSICQHSHKGIGSSTAFVKFVAMQRAVDRYYHRSILWEGNLVPCMGENYNFWGRCRATCTWQILVTILYLCAYQYMWPQNFCGHFFFFLIRYSWSLLTGAMDQAQWLWHQRPATMPVQEIVSCVEVLQLVRAVAKLKIKLLVYIPRERRREKEGGEGGGRSLVELFDWLFCPMLYYLSTEVYFLWVYPSMTSTSEHWMHYYILTL